jgi:hypothetical protein
MIEFAVLGSTEEKGEFQIYAFQTEFSGLGQSDIFRTTNGNISHFKSNL